MRTVYNIVSSKVEQAKPIILIRQFFRQSLFERLQHKNIIKRKLIAALAISYIKAAKSLELNSFSYSNVYNERKYKSVQCYFSNDRITTVFLA